MKLRDFKRNELQINYGSQSYIRFETDFYLFSILNIPLTFLIDDILLSMAEAQQNYFILPAKNSRDSRDHYYYFKISTHTHNQFIRVYEYDYML